ncbi:MAG: hypothetical protein ABEJ58_06855 [Halodesulfurarchaeum sp.]
MSFFFKHSAGRQPETGQRLAVDRDCLFVQERIQNVPELPEVTTEARA